MKTANLVSEEYVEQLQQVHANKKDWGGGNVSAKEFPHYAHRMQDLGVNTILDYGCGCGLFKPWMEVHNPGYIVEEYDPGIPGKDALPQPADFVVCCDVLEHVEPDKLENVLKHIKSVATKGAYLVVALFVSKLELPDGRQAHLIVNPGKWWINQISKVFDNVEVVRKDQHKVAIHVS